MATQEQHLQEPLMADNNHHHQHHHHTNGGSNNSNSTSPPPHKTQQDKTKHHAHPHQYRHRPTLPPSQVPLPNPSLQITPDHQLHLVPNTPVYLPQPGTDKEVLIHVKTTGICGSDVHFWKDGRIGALTVDGDALLGHEAAGVVVRCGSSEDSKFKPGDRVAIEPGMSCETCFQCRAGRYNLCDDVAFSGVYPFDGTLQRYKVHSARWLHKLPDNLDFTQGALLEPLSVALAALRVAHLTLGRGVVVCGAGPIGLATLLAARASGAHPIVVTDLEPTRLAFARELVPSCVPYQVDRALGARANARAIRALFGARGGEGEVGDEYPAPPCVIECTGVESSVCTAAFTVRRGGRIVVVGVGKDTMNNLPFMHLSLSEIELRFINRYTDTWPAAISCMSAGIVDMRKLVTHTFPLEKAVEGLTLSSDPRNGSIKVHIVDEAETVFF